MAIKIEKIEYKLAAESDIPFEHIKCERNKIRRLDVLPVKCEKTAKLFSACGQSDVSAEPGYSHTVVRFHQPAVLYFVKLGKFSHQGVRRIRLRSGLDNNGLIIFDYTVKIADAVPQNHQLKHSQDGEQIVSQALTFEYKMMRKCNRAKLDAVDLEFFGLKNEQLIRETMQRIKLNRELLSVKLCLKLFRDQKRYDIVQLLEKETKVQLEHTMLSQLYQNIVLKTDYLMVERIMRRAAKENFLKEYLQNRTESKISWEKLESYNCPTARTRPQMCLDNQNQIIYLFGGSSRVSRHNSLLLNDLWSFSLSTFTWKMLSGNTGKQGTGPCARVKATMIFHSSSKKLLIGGGMSASAVLLHDLYEYDIESGKWHKLGQFEKGKSDIDNPSLYWFNEQKPTQVYCFPRNDQSSKNDPALVWYFKRLSSGDCSSELDQNTQQTIILDTKTGKQRRVMSMQGMMCSAAAFNPTNSSFYLLAINPGRIKRNVEKALYQLDTQTNECVHLAQLPFSVCTHMFVDDKTGDLFCPTYSDPSLPSTSTCFQEYRHQLWHYQAHTQTWRLSVRQEHSIFQKNGAEVYDNVAKVFYGFRGMKKGKNAEVLIVPELWRMQVHTTSLAELLDKCLWNVLINQFVDFLSAEQPLQAMLLVRKMTARYGHLEQYKRQIHLLSQQLFRPETRIQEDRAGRVKELFDYLSNFFPKSMQSPTENLMDIVGHEYSWDFKDTHNWR